MKIQLLEHWLCLPTNALTSWLGMWRVRETAKDHIATVCETRHREEFQLEVAAMFREISVTFSESTAFLSLCSVL